MLQEAGDNNQFCWRNLFSCINLLRILNKLTKWKHSRTMVSEHHSVFTKGYDSSACLYSGLFSTRCWSCSSRLPSWRGRWRSSRPWCSSMSLNCSKCRPSTWVDSGGRATWRPCLQSTRKFDIASMTTGPTETVSLNEGISFPTAHCSERTQFIFGLCLLWFMLAGLLRYIYSVSSGRGSEILRLVLLQKDLGKSVQKTVQNHLSMYQDLSVNIIIKNSKRPQGSWSFHTSIKLR